VGYPISGTRKLRPDTQVRSWWQRTAVKIMLLFAVHIDYIFHFINTLVPVASPRLCQHLIALLFHPLGPRGPGYLSQYTDLLLSGRSGIASR